MQSVASQEILMTGADFTFATSSTLDKPPLGKGVTEVLGITVRNFLTMDDLSQTK